MKLHLNAVTKEDPDVVGSCSEVEAVAISNSTVEADCNSEEEADWNSEEEAAYTSAMVDWANDEPAKYQNRINSKVMMVLIIRNLSEEVLQKCQL